MDNKFRAILDNLPLSIWVRDLNNNIVFVNNKFKEIHNFKTNDTYTKIDKMCKLCKFSRECRDEIHKVIVNKRESSFNTSDGRYSSKCSVSPYLDNENNVMGTIGITMDISEIIQKQKEIEEREDILQTIIDTLPNYIFYKDKNLKYVGVNKKWREHYNKCGTNEVIGKSDLDIESISKDKAIEFIKQDKEVMNTKKIKREEIITTNSDGRTIIEETIKVPVINEDGEVWGIVGLSTDITETIKLREKLTRLSYTDSLTGVYNRAYFEEKKEELNKSANLPMGIIMGDVNGLKVTNDTFGHIEGDNLLVSMSKILKSINEKNKYIFRWGGDEFIILIPNCNETKCEEITKEIMSNCKNSEFDLIDMSMSLGYSIKKDQHTDIYENLKEAEEKLYRQKLLTSKSIRSSLIFSLNQSMQEKSLETEQHTNRLIDYALKIGKKINMNTSELGDLELVAKFHDIGKIGISEDILMKKGKLTELEFEIVKTHTEKGYRILKASGELSHIAKGVLSHHERYDGRGYPLGIEGKQIPLTSRIVNIVDSYDAMVSDRGYNKVKSKKEAIKEIKICKGTQFDPYLAEVFIDILKNEEEYC